MGEVHVNKDDITNIANAIRTQKGESSSKKYKVNQMATAIGTLIHPSGTINITSNGTTDVTNYASANVNVGEDEPVEITTSYKGYGAGRGGYASYYIPKMNVSTYNSCEYLFYNYQEMTDVEIDFGGKPVSLDHMFEYCYKLKNITYKNLNTTNLIQIDYLYSNCRALVDIPVIDTSNITNMNKTYNRCDSLSNTSLNNILLMCANATGILSTKTLDAIGLSSTQATTCTTLSNWQACVTAGWTTGY